MRSLKNGKKIIVFFSCIIFCIFFSGCCSTKCTESDTTNIIARNSFAAGQLESTVKALDGTVNDSRTRISNIIETSRGIENGIERIEFLFRQYEFEVDRLLNEIDTIRAEIEAQTKNN